MCVKCQTANGVPHSVLRCQCDVTRDLTGERWLNFAADVFDRNGEHFGGVKMDKVLSFSSST